jgi:peptidylprolyl isomerase
MAPKYNRKQPAQHQPKRDGSKKKRWLIIIGILAIFLIIIGAYYAVGLTMNNSNPTPTPTPTPTATPTTSPTSTPQASNKTRVLLHTTMGDITIELRDDMPITTGNFIKLVKDSTYNGVIFHRVRPSFMIQGGDPTGTGYGDSSIPNIQDEFTSNNHNNRGTIAMANTGQPNSGSSQFFINVVDNNYLDELHPVFGTVVSGMTVADNIANVPRNANDKPLTDVIIISATIVS